MDWNFAGVVDSAALRVRGAAGHRHRLWGMEDAQPEQGSWSKETRAQWSRRAFELKCRAFFFCGTPLDNEHRYPGGEHGNGGDCDDDPPQARTRLILHQLPVGGNDEDGHQKKGRQ